MHCNPLQEARAEAARLRDQFNTRDMRRVIQIQNAVSSELDRHAAAIECDQSISKIHLTVVIGRKNGMPEHVTYSAVSYSPLTAKRSAVRVVTFDHQRKRS